MARSECTPAWDTQLFEVGLPISSIGWERNRVVEAWHWRHANIIVFFPFDLSFSNAPVVQLFLIKMKVSIEHHPQRSDRHVPCVIDMPPTSSSHTPLEEDPHWEEVTRSDVEGHVQSTRSERSTQTDEVANSQIPMLNETEKEELSALELLRRLHTILTEMHTILMAMEWPLTALTILLPLIPFLGILWSRFWLTTFNVDWALSWMLMGILPLFVNRLRRLGGLNACGGPSGCWIYKLLLFGFLILMSLASLWSQAPGVYARMILLFSLRFWLS